MLARACAAKPGLLLIDGALDALPYGEAQQLLTWLSQPEHPWALVVVTGREQLAAICRRTIELPAPPSFASAALLNLEN
jgi:predicted ABC-type transport system involved in lysophospholipase L1 biosynthesis ATPase subunit